MSRGDGWSTADISTRYFLDPKLRRLWRALDEPTLMADAVVAHLALVLASWAEGERVTLDEATPDWLTLSPAITIGLRRAGLVDRGGRLPKRSWDSWYAPAEARRAVRRELGRRGGLAKASRALAQPEPSSSKRSTRTVPISTDPSDRARAREAEPRRGATNGPTSLRDALEGTPLGQAIAARKPDES